MKTSRALNHVLRFVIALTIFAILAVCGGFFYSAIFAYPQPEYSVDTFAQLQEKLGQADENYVLPNEDFVKDLGYGADFTVLLKDRFHDDPTGYRISVYTAEDKTKELSVDCRLLEDFDDESRPTVDPSEEYKGVGLKTWDNDGGTVVFIYNGCYYTVQTESVEHSLQIAQAIIDKNL